MGYVDDVHKQRVQSRGLLLAALCRFVTVIVNLALALCNDIGLGSVSVRRSLHALLLVGRVLRVVAPLSCCAQKSVETTTNCDNGRLY